MKSSAPRVRPQQRRIRFFLFAILPVAIVFGASLGILVGRGLQPKAGMADLPPVDAEGWRLREGDAMVEFSSPDLDGSLFSLANTHGAPRLILFGAHWCGPCAVEMDEVERELVPRHVPRGLVVVFIGVDDSAEDMLPMRARLKPSFPLIPDPDSRLFNLVADDGLPRSLLIDAEGKIVERHVGYNSGDWRRLDRSLARLLAE